MCYLLLSPVPPHDMTTLFNKYAHVYEGRIFAKNILESTAKAILKPGNENRDESGERNE